MSAGGMNAMVMSAATDRPVLVVEDASKAFTLHLRDGARLPVVRGIGFTVAEGECVVLGGPSGAGKSSVLKMIHGGYRCDSGRILVRADGEVVDVARAEPRAVLRLRRETVGYVSQFLRVIPRVPTLEVVAEPLLAAGCDRAEALRRAGEMLARLALPEKLWRLPPATFSGGEQQRVNIARGFIAPRRLLLLDEPTASLDAANRAAVVALIDERKRGGTAVLGIFHDADVRDRVADRVVDVVRYSAAA
jgi:alpha-D-ribose 1-methylphosphonate 5-triphosphate synthase subunit PhnL